MTEFPHERDHSGSDRHPRVSGEQVYLVAAENIQHDIATELSLFDLMRVMWRDKFLIIGLTALFGIGAIAYALLAEEWYAADVLMVSAEDSSNSSLSGSLVGQLGGLAGLAGVSVTSGDSVEALAVLTSREFTGAFIEDEDLLTVLFESDWDESTQSWMIENPDDWPDTRDAIKYFDENVRTVSEDAATGLVRLTIEWTDAETAAKWANLLVSRLNNQMRQRALNDADRNIQYLTEALNSATVVTLQESISGLLETELQKHMLARGNEEFAFRVIDRAQAPKRRSRPQRTILVLIVSFLGGVISVLMVVIRHAASIDAKRAKRTSASAE